MPSGGNFSRHLGNFFMEGTQNAGNSGSFGVKENFLRIHILRFSLKGVRKAINL